MLTTLILLSFYVNCYIYFNLDKTKLSKLKDVLKSYFQSFFSNFYIYIKEVEKNLNNIFLVPVQILI